MDVGVSDKATHFISLVHLRLTQLFALLPVHALHTTWRSSTRRVEASIAISFSRLSVLALERPLRTFAKRVAPLQLVVSADIATSQFCVTSFLGQCRLQPSRRHSEQ